MVRTGRGPLRPVWRAAHALIARGIAVWLRRGVDVSVYLCERPGSGRPIYGLSDIDLGAITASPEAVGQVQERWATLCRRLPWLGRLVECHYVADQATAAAACRDTVLTHGLPPGPPATAPALYTTWPGLYEPMGGWRLLAGPQRLPADRRWSADDLPLAGWLELRLWWRVAFLTLAQPGTPWFAFTCVKLVSEPARIALWLEHRERPPTRRAALERANELFPEAQTAFGHALELLATLTRTPSPDPGLVVAGLVASTARVAAVLDRLADGVGSVPVALEGSDPLVAEDARPPTLQLAGGPVELLPLADWAARVLPVGGDAAFAVVPGHVADPARLAAAAAARRPGLFPALRDGDLLVRPATDWTGAHLRGVDTPVTDPVSFALVDGRADARFPELPGWSARDGALRAVSEHDSRLRAGRVGLAGLFAAARAALWLQSLDDGEPRLALTSEAAGQGLAERDPELIREALSRLRAERLDGAEAPEPLVDRLREAVLRMPAFGGSLPGRAGHA